MTEKRKSTQETSKERLKFIVDNWSQIEELALAPLDKKIMELAKEGMSGGKIADQITTPILSTEQVNKTIAKIIAQIKT